jgi:hypothetical protein
MAAGRYEWWQQEAQIRMDKRERLKGRLKLFMESHYASNPGVCGNLSTRFLLDC